MTVIVLTPASAKSEVWSQKLIVVEVSVDLKEAAELNGDVALTVKV